MIVLLILGDGWVSPRFPFAGAAAFWRIGAEFPVKSGFAVIYVRWAAMLKSGRLVKARVIERQAHQCSTHGDGCGEQVSQTIAAVEGGGHVNSRSDEMG